MSSAGILGIDIGGVITNRVSEDRPFGTSKADEYTHVSPVEGALVTIARLVSQRFETAVWLVSRCDQDAEQPILEWLERNGFFRVTGVSRNRVRFCRERRTKAAICRELDITHFIDDRLEVLSHLVDIVPNLYLLRSRAGDPARFHHILSRVHVVTRWSDMIELLIPPAAEGTYTPR